MSAYLWYSYSCSEIRNSEENHSLNNLLGKQGHYILFPLEFRKSYYGPSDLDTDIYISSIVKLSV